MPQLEGVPDDLINALTRSVKNAIPPGIFSKTINCLTQLKFEKTCIYPYPESMPEKGNETPIQAKCNFVEFLNQLFTTVASIKAVEYLLKEKKGNHVELCLGTATGRDLTLYDKKGGKKIAVAEIFAVTDPDSNKKLKDEIKSLAKGEGGERYAFFILADDAFENLNKEKKSKQYWWQSWTNYTPKKQNNGEAQGEKIETTDNLSIDRNHATWSCKCNDKTITIVCWPSTCCLKNFSPAQDRR